MGDDRRTVAAVVFVGKTVRAAPRRGVYEGTLYWHAGR
jgi:hypothetical protein